MGIAVGRMLPALSRQKTEEKDVGERGGVPYSERDGGIATVKKKQKGRCRRRGEDLIVNVSKEGCASIVRALTHCPICICTCLLRSAHRQEARIRYLPTNVLRGTLQARAT